METLDKLMTVKEVADYLRLSEKAVRTEIYRKKIGFTRVGPKGGNVLVRKSEVERYVNERTCDSGNREE